MPSLRRRCGTDPSRSVRRVFFRLLSTVAICVELEYGELALS